MKISVVVCTRYGIPISLRQSLNEQTRQADEIIEVIGKSLTKQRNEGISRAKGDIILFLDDDMRLVSNYIEEIEFVFKIKQDAMAVTGKVGTLYDGYNYAGYLYDLFANIFLISRRGYGNFRISGFPESYDFFSKGIYQSEVLHGCNMAIRKEAFDEFKFNETLEGGMYGEDDDFSYRLSRKYHIYYSSYAYCFDFRNYPKGKQAWKVRCTILNLIKRYHDRKPNLIGRVAFWWAMLGFILFKLIEALVMRDSSIVKGVFSVWKKTTQRYLESI